MDVWGCHNATKFMTKIAGVHIICQRSLNASPSQEYKLFFSCFWCFSNYTLCDCMLAMKPVHATLSRWCRQPRVIRVVIMGEHWRTSVHLDLDIVDCKMTDGIVWLYPYQLQILIRMMIPDLKEFFLSTVDGSELAV